jgi:AcrR family transcriptional regulator
VANVTGTATDPATDPATRPATDLATDPANEAAFVLVPDERAPGGTMALIADPPATHPDPFERDPTADTDTSDTSDATDGTDADGRRVRRDRNRDAVVDALLELLHQGELQPSSTQIAERAGLSPRSLFRYFDDVDDLSRAAIERQQLRVWPLARAHVRLDAPLDERIAAVVDARVRFFEASGNVGRVARLREPFQPVIAAGLATGRAALRRQLRDLFTPELDALGTTRATSTLAALDVLCSYESYRLMRDDQAMTRAKVTATLVDAVTRLLRDPASDREAR